MAGLLCHFFLDLICISYVSLINWQLYLNRAGLLNVVSPGLLKCVSSYSLPSSDSKTTTLSSVVSVLTLPVLFCLCFVTEGDQDSWACQVFFLPFFPETSFTVASGFLRQDVWYVLLYSSVINNKLSLNILFYFRRWKPKTVLNLYLCRCETIIFTGATVIIQTSSRKWYLPAHDHQL